MSGGDSCFAPSFSAHSMAMQLDSFAARSHAFESGDTYTPFHIESFRVSRVSIVRTALHSLLPRVTSVHAALHNLFRVSNGRSSLHNLFSISCSQYPLLHRRSHGLEMLEHSHITIHESIDAVLHARLFRSVELARRNLARNALLEAAVCEAVDGLDDGQFVSIHSSANNSAIERDRNSTKRRGRIVRDKYKSKRRWILTLLHSRLLSLVDHELLEILLLMI